MSSIDGGAAEAGELVSLLLVLYPDPELDSEAGERLARRLRAELVELDVESIAPVVGETLPEGAKGTDLVTLGELIVVLSASGGVFVALIGTLRDWLGRQSGRHRLSVTIDGDTLELERASAEQQQALVDAYVQRHADG
ncbi:MAG: effector-associated constant component EACC1 [Pseudonocardia sp.]